MSLDDGKLFYQRLILLAKGKILPDRENPYEWITYDLFASMRAVDEAQTEGVLQDAILCVTSQVDEARNHCASMGDLLKQRYKEGGVRYLSPFNDIYRSSSSLIMRHLSDNQANLYDVLTGSQICCSRCDLRYGSPRQ